MSTGKKPDQAYTNKDVAIVGMACIFPGAGDLKKYWQNILNKVDAITEPPQDWGGDSWFDPASSAPDRIYNKRGGYLGDLSRFDPLQFGIMPAAVDGAEPEHFLALRVAAEALADAGIPHLPLNRERTEVIIGRGTFINRGYTSLHQHGLFIDQTLKILKDLQPEYTEEQLAFLKERFKASLPPLNSEIVTGLVSSIMSGRIANRLDLKGANYCVDAACASSLIAVELGVQGLLAGKCDAVLAGGIQLSTHHMMLMVFSQLGALSRSHQIRPFAQDADGTLLGEGVGFVVLKRRVDAERDGSRIYAVVKTVGSSSDGRGKSVVAPRVEGEELALRRAYEAAGIDPGTVGLLEAHGTAMPMGDVTELQALTRVFPPRAAGSPYCALGSVKSMIAHLIPAAGMAGLIKVALALYQKVLPPTLHGEQPNLKIERTPFYLNTETRPWIHGALMAPRRAGVNAFGFGGINAHAVLEEYTTAPESDSDLWAHWDTELFIFQGDSRQSLIEQGEQVLGLVETAPGVELPDLAYTLNSDLGDKPYKLAVVATSAADLQGKLAHALKRLRDPGVRRIKEKSGIYFFAEPLAPQGGLAFLFPGEGSQYPNMLADLCLHFPEVRSCFDLLDEAFAAHPREYLPSQLVFPHPNHKQQEIGPEGDKLWHMEYAADAVITADRALLRLFSRLGIRPGVIVGHSSGEIMALEAAGALTLSSDRELREHIHASNAMIAQLTNSQEVPDALLIAVGAVNRSVVTQVVQESEGRLFLAMDNCPNQFVLCGLQETMDRALEDLRSSGGIYQVLPFARPYHTPLFKPALGPMRDFFQRLRLASPAVQMYSCMTAAPMPADPEEIRRLAVEQWAQPVRFQETIEAMYKAGTRIFLEVGPKANLTSFINDILKKKPHLAAAANVHFRSGLAQLHHALGLLAAHGVPMRLDYLYQRRNPRKIALVAGGEICARPPENEAPKLHLSLPVLRVEKEDREAFHCLAASHPPSLTPEKVPDPDGAEAVITDFNAPTSQAPGDRRLDHAGPGQRTPAPGQNHSRVIAEYLSTMEQFLLTQQEVMQAYLSGNPAPLGSSEAANTRETGQPAHTLRSPELAGAPASSPVGTEASPPSPAISAAALAAPAGSSPMTRESLEQALLSHISARTGYPQDILKVDQDLEADLGIDSIKRVEILEALRGDLGIIGPAVMDRLMSLQTIQEMVDFLVQQQAESPAAVTTPGRGLGGDLPALPLIGTVASHTPGEEVVLLREFALTKDLFLLDHTLGRNISITDPELTGLPIMPLTISMEIMAEAATVLIPDQLFIGMRDIRAYRWITFEHPQVTLKIQAKRLSSAEVQVQIRGADEPAGLPILEGIMVFGETYPEPPPLGVFSLQNRRPSIWTSEELYSGGMFSGPSFQGMASVDWWGEDGIEGTLKTLPLTGMFQSRSDVRFIADPLLLDAAGQLVAYWIADNSSIGFNVYPYRVEALQIYGPPLPPGNLVKCRARINPMARHQLRSTLEIIGPSGALHMRLTGWDDRSFDLPDKFYRIRFRASEVMLSTPWPESMTQFFSTNCLVCCRLDDFPNDLLNAHGQVWRRVLAFLALSRREREKWLNLSRPEGKRTEWLLARIAGKDAARLYLKNRYGLELCLPDIEIVGDEHGRPYFHGPWTDKLDLVPSLSLSHTRGVGLALVSESIQGCGIDVEQLDPNRQRLDFVLIPEELQQIKSRLPAPEQEWLLRFWCAKEAVGKALGRGLPRGPRDLLVRDWDMETGAVLLELSAKLSQELFPLKETKVQAWTRREGDLIIALASYPGERKD